MAAHTQAAHTQGKLHCKLWPHPHRPSPSGCPLLSLRTAAPAPRATPPRALGSGRRAAPKARRPCVSLAQGENWQRCDVIEGACTVDCGSAKRLVCDTTELQSLPRAGSMVPHASVGYCSSGYYAGADGKGTASRAACNALCQASSRCIRFCTAPQCHAALPPSPGLSLPVTTRRTAELEAGPGAAPLVRLSVQRCRAPSQRLR